MELKESLNYLLEVETQDHRLDKLRWEEYSHLTKEKHYQNF